MAEDVSLSESALVVLVPEAESVVEAWRIKLDPSATWGVPAHITLLYPFVTPLAIDADVTQKVTQALATFSPSDYRLLDVRWFGNSVAWLSPEPTSLFVEMTLALMEAFPSQPRYGGAYGDEIVPHLTIAEGAPLDRMQQAADAITSDLPLQARVERVALLVGNRQPNSWRVQESFPLT